MERKKITIDGMHFSTLEEFYDEIDRLLTKDLTWKTGRSMDAFHDLLRGGFGVHEYGEGLDFYWLHAEKSRRDFGYEATALYWENILKRCHPSNRERVAAKLEAAKNQAGETLFDIIVKEILDKKCVYDHTLTFDEGEKRLQRAFFMTDALTLSKNLIGKVLVHDTPLGTVRGIITETEAYMGVTDKGSHTYGGRRTDRTEPMFHIGGTSYVYFIYGMYNCVNVTAGAVDVPMASLIRMVEPFDDASRKIMERFRLGEMERKRERRKKRLGEAAGTDAGKEGLPVSLKKHLADGPGKLCIAMNITKEDNDIDLAVDEHFYLTEGIEVKEERISIGKRIGIDYAEEAADYLWRFTLT